MQRDSAVIFVTGTLEVGGSETKIVKLANALAKAGYQAAIAYLNLPDSLLDKVDPGVPITHLDRRGKYSVKSLRKLNQLINKKYRTVVSVNFYPLLYVVPAVRCFSDGLTKAISLINTMEFVDGQWMFGPIYAPFIRRCDKLVFGCEAQKSLWTKKYHLPVDRSRIIYNGVDSDFYSLSAIPESGRSFRLEVDIPVDAIVIGSVGRFAPEKHFSLLIETLGRLHSAGRNAYLVLVGRGEERARLEQAAAQRGVFDKMRFPGVLNDVRPAIAAMDIFVLPSRAETFSNAALEAMAMERPVVLSNIGGAAEMIEDLVSGMLFEAGDIETLTQLLVTLYDSGELRKQIGTAARQRIINSFSFSDMVSRYEDLLFS